MLTYKQIDEVAERCIKSMRYGVQQFCAPGGWRQFARAIIDAHETEVEKHLPRTIAHKGTKEIKPGEALLDAGFCRCVIAVLLLRADGEMLSFTQEEFDTIRGMSVMEGYSPGKGLLLKLKYPEK